MEKKIKNPRGMTVEFRLEVANTLRDFCSKTGITLTRAINNAVEAYMPKIQKMMEAMQGVDAEDESSENISMDADFDKLYDSLFRGCFEITHNESDFVPAYEFKEIITNAIEDSDMYRNAGLKYDSRFLDFLERRYGLVATRSQSHSRKRGYEGIIHGEWF